MNQFWQAGEGTSPSRPICGPLSGISILVVEDDTLSREGLSLVLENYGADVATAGNVEEAIRSLDDELPTVLISDIGLPGQDGLQLIRRVRAGEDASPRRLPAIALSGFSDLSLPGASRAAGFDAFLAKPIDIPVLLSTIERLTSDRRNRL